MNDQTTNMFQQSPQASHNAAGADAPANDPSDEISRYIAASGLSQSFRTGPEITREEIAGFYAGRLIERISELKKASSRAQVYTVEFPFMDFHVDVTLALAKAVGGFTLKTLAEKIGSELESQIMQQMQEAGAQAPKITQEVFQQLQMRQFNAALNTPKFSLVLPLPELANAEPEMLINFLNHNQDVFLVCHRSWQLPNQIKSLIDRTVSIRRFDPAKFQEACRDFYELDSLPTLNGDVSWINKITPRDFLINSQAEKNRIVESMASTVTNRLHDYTPIDALPLDDLNGNEDATSWASDYAEEIRLAVAGKLSWDQVERTAVLAGPSGVGKKTLVKSIAAAAGMQQIVISAIAFARDQEAQPGIVNGVFLEALSMAPAILFIDDFEILNEPSMTPARLMVHEHLKQLRDEDALIVFAGTEVRQEVRSLFRQEGLFETIIEMSPPNSKALAQLYRSALKNVTHTLSDEDFNHLGMLSLGLDGNNVQFLVKQAARIARKQNNRPVSKNDLIQIFSREQYGQRSTSLHRTISKEEMANTAYHESGHAILQLMGQRHNQLAFATIIPRENGTLGFMAPGRNEALVSMTRQDIIDKIRCALAGRAAEEVQFGAAKVTSGCTNDLRQATGWVMHLLTESGFDSFLSFDRDIGSDQVLLEKANTILAQEYQSVVDVLTKHKPLLDRFSDLLIERQEVSGDELTHIYKQHIASVKSA